MPNRQLEVMYRVQHQDWTQKIQELTGNEPPRYNGKIEIPEQLQVELIKSLHEHPVHGHQGTFKTTSRI